jgi:hypothetical protein
MEKLMTKTYTALETFATAQERLERFKELSIKLGSNQDIKFKLDYKTNEGMTIGINSFLLEYTVKY